MYLRNSSENPEQWPIHLFALPESQTMFKEIAKSPYYRINVAISASPVQLSFRDIEEGARKLSGELAAQESKEYNKLLDKKFINQLIDIAPAVKEGKVLHLFVATSNLADNSGGDSEIEYDRRQVLSALADDVIISDGKVFILDQEGAPDEKSLTTILRYQKRL